MAVYEIIDIKIFDQDIYSEFQEKIGTVVGSFEGSFLVQSGDVTTLFGESFQENDW